MLPEPAVFMALGTSLTVCRLILLGLLGCMILTRFIVSLNIYVLHRCFFLSVTTDLVLPSNNLVGTIASELGLLSQLRIIDLSGNPGLVGTIPTELASIASLSEYQVLYAHLEQCCVFSLETLTC
jgi:hypothetical protein